MEPALFIMTGMVVMLFLVFLRHRYFGFLSQTPTDYADAGGPSFDLQRDLNGPILCEGVIYGPMGRVQSRFVGHFDASWDGDSGVMRERFEYDNGEVQFREWRLKIGQDGAIEARADDVEGVGRGTQSGPSVQLRYRLRLPEDAGGHVLDAVDWMYLAPNGTIVNRSQFRKFGIRVVELVATMRKKETA
ncbi:DUF3833 family protein [Thalassococcus sp. BH17M4-6]|uniref:DUF3833 family protein n=1 Tax=Thalassococcus sp. BH17M4-6 TaxID=3413148 RepID=UPI003BC10904